MRIGQTEWSEANGIPVARAALELGLTREQVIRRITRQEIAGGQARNRAWFVAPEAVLAAVDRERAA
jgi:hypothetical protein